MKLVIQILLWVLIAFLGYKVYDSVYSSVRFEKEKEERFATAVQRLKQIRTAQAAYKTVTGKYANSYEKMAQFIDTAKFTITQQRDSSFIRFDKQLKIDRSIDTVVFDILGYESIKDSLFSDIDYKNFKTLKFGQDQSAEVELETSVVEKNEILYPTYKISIAKRDLLKDQEEIYIKEEESLKGLSVIDGKKITVGSLDEVNTNGNWPLSYDN